MLSLTVQKEIGVSHNDSAHCTRYLNLRKRATEEEFDKIDFDRVYKIYNERFADAGSFTFVIVGAFELDSIKPLLETYLGSLPAIGCNLLKFFRSC